jgi:hypothetical protein
MNPFFFFSVYQEAQTERDAAPLSEFTGSLLPEAETVSQSTEVIERGHHNCPYSEK